MNTLQAHWERFLASAIKQGVTANDIKHIKAAYYLGASSLDHLLRGITQMDCSIEGKKAASLSVLQEIADFFEGEHAELLREVRERNNGQD